MPGRLALPRLCLRGVIVAVMVVSIAACGTLDPLLRPGWRHVVIPVHNRSAAPAFVVVAISDQRMGKVVGTADPGTVPPMSDLDVTVGLPPAADWGLFVNVAANQNLMLLPGDVPATASGRAPITIEIDKTGQVGVTSPALPGWMGQ